MDNGKIRRENNSLKKYQSTASKSFDFQNHFSTVFNMLQHSQDSQLEIFTLWERLEVCAFLTVSSLCLNIKKKYVNLGKMYMFSCQCRKVQIISLGHFVLKDFKNLSIGLVSAAFLQRYLSELFQHKSFYGRAASASCPTIHTPFCRLLHGRHSGVSHEGKEQCQLPVVWIL